MLAFCQANVLNEYDDDAQFPTNATDESLFCAK